MHVSRHGYTPDASGYALDQGVEIFTLSSLTQQLVNFDAYIQAVEREPLREIILNEYQPTKIHFDGKSLRTAKPAIEFVNEWLTSSSRWLTVLGDYGVGKSWMLKRFLYWGIDQHKKNPEAFPLPFFIPLQNFTKAFDYQNLILRVFQMHGLARVPYEAFEHLASSGRILFLFDSFDEMAQHLHRETIRENLKELLSGMSGESKAIMTSRPTYFESRAERLVAVDMDGSLTWHPLDRTVEENKVALSIFLTRALETSHFARLTDLSLSQRRKLFAIVLGPGSRPYKTLRDLLERFTDLGSISQRAVIARLLTTVAETLASGDRAQTIEGYPLLPDNVQILNQGKIFEIVIHNLLYRDQQIGTLSAGDRYFFLRSFAVFMQQPGRVSFAEPEEIRSIVEQIFSGLLRTTDAREQLVEQFYRTCRRHSGLTTESQFNDTTGQLDLPVEETDATSKVGFSHNSLREYLVADAFGDFLLNGTQFSGLNTVIVTDAVANFFADLLVYTSELSDKLKSVYEACKDSNLKERLFRLLIGLIERDGDAFVSLLGKPPKLNDLDLSGLDLSGLPLQDSDFQGSTLPDVDLRSADLRKASFKGAILNSTMLDGSKLDAADFMEAEIQSIFVYDTFDKRTSLVLTGKDARQWLFSRGAIVDGEEELNALLGQPWYEAAREVTRTLQQKMAGTHQDSSLAKGTDLKYRSFAGEFVKHLRNKGALVDVRKSKHGSMLVKMAPEYRTAIKEFNDKGAIDPILQSFFDKYL